MEPRSIQQKRDLPKGCKQNDDAGLRPERPFQILGITTEVSLGDLLLNVIFFSTIANYFDHARLHVKFRDIRPYARQIMSLSPWVDLAEPIAEWPPVIRRMFPKWGPRELPNVGKLNGGRAYHYDIVVTNQMAKGIVLHALPDPVVLRLPVDQAQSLCAELEKRGLEPDRWFAVFHYREANYEFRVGVNSDAGARESRPEAFDALVDQIIALGGQAVRLGHAGMAPFRERKGFVDLSREPDSFMLQAAAASHARFMVAGPSGPIALALAFHIPVTLVDAIDQIALWGPADILTHEVIRPSGERLRNESLLRSGLLDSYRLVAEMNGTPGYQIRKTSAAELAAAARRLYESTRDCAGWRAPAVSPPGRKPNTFTWPVRPTHHMVWAELPEF